MTITWSNTITMASVIAKQPLIVETLTNTILTIIPHDDQFTTYFVRVGNLNGRQTRQALSKSQHYWDRHPSNAEQRLGHNCEEIVSFFSFNSFHSDWLLQAYGPTQNKEMNQWKPPLCLLYSQHYHELEYEEELSLPCSAYINGVSKVRRPQLLTPATHGPWSEQIKQKVEKFSKKRKTLIPHLFSSRNT